MYSNNKSESGFSLLDLVIGIAILSFTFLATMRVADDFQSKFAQRDVQIRGTALANSMMSIIRSVNYDNNTNTPWTTASNLGMDANLLYDDVDDFIFNPMNAANFGNAALGFTITVNVIYVNPETSPPNLTVALIGGQSSDYKLIIVTVNHPNMNNPIILNSMITPNAF